MDIKLKRYNGGLKCLAFIALTALSCHMAFQAIQIFPHVERFSVFELIYDTDYTETGEFRNKVHDVIAIMETICNYKNEDYIKDGLALESTDDFNNMVEDLYQEVEWEIIEDLEGKERSEYITDERIRMEFNVRYRSNIEDIKKEVIQSQLYRFEEAKRELDSLSHIAAYYAGTESETYYSNSNYGSVKELYKHYYENVTSESSGGEKWIFAFENQYVEEKNSEMKIGGKAMKSFIAYSLVWLVLYLACLIYLIYAAGKRTSDSRGVRLLWMDKLWNEITLGCMVLVATGIGVAMMFLYDNEELKGRDANLFIQYVGVYLLGLLFMVFYWLFLMLVRHIKNKTLLRNTLIWIILKKIHKFVRLMGLRIRGLGSKLNYLYSKGNPMLKTVLLITTLGIFTMIPFAGFLTIPLALWIAYKKVTDFEKIKQGLNAIKQGGYNEQILIGDGSEFALLAADINKIASGLGEEVENRLKSERLKTELIVNVSHDVRTPLTSLITYTDLLKNEETDNENIKKYVDVISKKSNRLKVLMDDLFESAKAASGNVNASFGKVDVGALLTQGLAELNDRIQESTLEFKVNVDDSVIAWADGRLLWRVLENLLSNVLKYSMEHSRVYLNVYEDDKFVFVEIKNISATELNIPEDEIMERFKRGDVSRNSEGSGLGLDIAKSLMLCQNGDLSIKVDGDLFKVILTICKQ